MHSDFADLGFTDETRTQALPVRGGTARPPRKQRDKVKVAFLIILGIVVAALIAGGIYVWTLFNSFSQVTVIDDAFPDDAGRPVAVAEAQTFLLLGSDSRASGEATIRGRSDTIMVAHIPADHSTVQVMSIMRDNWVPIPGHGETKINAATAFGGIPLMVQTVEGILDTRIDHVAIIDFESFKGLTTAVGGVTVDNSTAFKAGSGEHFAAGEITLEGADALAFVRERKAFSKGDYQRAANQQLLVKGLISKILSAETLANPGRVSALVDQVSPFLSTDEGLDAGYLAGLAVTMRDIRAADVRFFTSPTLGTGTIKGQSIVKPDWDGLATISQAIKDGTLDQYEPTGK
ncbi:LCP family protein required for cell wall assembly [Microbacterium sp. W4I4]|uniref:LCP family protein n=1 Tax=Microbacterium sp. W4I4 TaxID=3042295 RepID=UPI0027861F64|nr:LCP family protein [Microbacterium sp. W4I4]MDQ0614821.1 LCP family protein required for cell wall assembly [Microbacterium sp. W4I4]